MLRPGLALLLAIVPAPALASDWRFVDAASSPTQLAFIDVDSISPRDGPLRSVATFYIGSEPAEDGAAATIVETRVDCPGRRLSIYRIVTYDENDRELRDLHGTRPFVGPMAPQTQGGALVDFACTNGGSDAAAPRAGARHPFEAARRILRGEQL